MPSKKRKRKGKGQVVCEEQGTDEAHPSSAQLPEQDENELESEQVPTSLETEMNESEDQDISPEALSYHLQKALTLKTPLAKRPDYGSRGNKIGLITNYFPLELPGGGIHHYDIAITVKRRDSTTESTLGSVESNEKKFRCLNTRLNREVFRQMLHQHGEFNGYIPAYDGRRNLYTKNSLKETLLEVPLKVELPVSDNDRPADDPSPRADVFNVVIKPVVKKETNDNVISLDTIHALYQHKVNHVSREAIMAMETILRNGPCFQYVPLGRSFFPWPDQGSNNMHPLSEGREIWFGYHQSLILTEWQPIVNIDTTATTFFKKQSLIAYVGEILKRSEEQLIMTPFLRDADIVQLSKKMKGVRVKATHLSYERQYRIIKLTRKPAGKLKFFMQTNEGPLAKTVSDYFLEKYNMTLQYPNLPCVQVRPEQKQIYLPLEVCNIVAGQHAREPLSQKEASKMVKVASLPPEERFRKIQEVHRQAQFNSDPCNREFGLKVSSVPMNVEGRIIHPPSISCYGDKLLKPMNGKWNMRYEKFFHGAKINSWVLLSFANEINCNRNDLDSFIDLLVSVGEGHGLRLEEPQCVRTFREHNSKVRNILEDIKAEFQDVELAIIVLQSKSSSFYSAVKQASDTVLGLVTQCVQASNVMKLDPSVVSNICLKINVKMGGVNCSLTAGDRPVIFEKPVIIIGADVTHPLPGSGCRPSIAAVVASLDRHPSRYAVTLRTQMHTNIKKNAVEIILDLEQMVMELLRTFYRETNKKPVKIIFFRDGVSEGQLVEVRNYELRALRKACMRLDADYKPGITFIVVQKRHHTRFKPQNPREGVGPTKNIPPGTVIDKRVCNIIHFDFFLCSHFGLQGTSRPSHYIVVSDDNKFTSDELQKLIYYLCHTSARCAKSISIPAPVQYAHLAAYRASKYLEAELGESSVSSDKISASEYQKLLDRWKEITAVIPEMKNRMYFI